jgi:hypothetical protein
MTNRKSTPRAISVTGSTYDRVSNYAKSRGVPMTKVVDNLVNNYLDKLEIGYELKPRLPDDGYPPLLTPGDDGDD